MFIRHRSMSSFSQTYIKTLAYSPTELPQSPIATLCSQSLILEESTDPAVYSVNASSSSLSLLTEDDEEEDGGLLYLTKARPNAY